MNVVERLQILLRQITPNCASRFKLELTSDSQEEYFSLEDGEDQSIRLTASTPSALAVGAYRFLRDRLNFHWTWCGSSPAQDDRNATVGKPVRQALPLPLRPYLNYCTFGYSTVWWDWQRWQREIDFMALNGINMPLTVTGLEMVWLKTLRRFEIPDQDILNFLSGPAFLPWQFMVNMDSHAGPMPMNWIKSHAELGNKIAQRQREWGMKPILPGFNGHVPEAFIRKYPDVDIITGTGWCGFPPVHQINPADPAFAKVNQVFLEELVDLFGTSHYYSIDLFHEQNVPDDSPEYLASCGRNLARKLLDFDPQAVWVMQAWSERREIIQAIPQDHLLILDIGKERLEATHGLYGVPTVWGTIHSFGGQTEIGGNLAAIPKTIAQRRKAYPNLVGAGAFPESIDNNPVLFQLVFDAALVGGNLELRPWLHDYLKRRYGKQSQTAQEAWDLMLNAVYTQRRGDPVFAARPGLSITKANAWAGFSPDDIPQRFFPAWKKLLEAAENLSHTEGLVFDIIDVGRQALSALGKPFLDSCRQAFNQQNPTRFRQTTQRFLTLMKDCDQLLACHPVFRLDRWTADARAWGKTPEEADFYEWNARLQLTLWGPVPNPEPLFDYCCREWNGLLSDYHIPRWQRFFDYALKQLQQGKSLHEETLPKLEGRFLLKANDFYAALYHDLEEPFPRQHGTTAAQPHPNPLQLARELCDRYAPCISLEPPMTQTTVATNLVAGFTGDLVAGFTGDHPVVL